MIVRDYETLSKFKTFDERLEYLKLDGVVGRDTFGYDRYLNQLFYKSPEWKAVRRQIIIRDNGCDLGVPGNEIYGIIFIHHMNPISKEDIVRRSAFLLDPNYLICVSNNTHRVITYGDVDLIDHSPVVRFKNDTCPWKKR